MPIFDLLFSRRIDAAELMDALAEAFSAGIDRVAVIHDVRDLPEVESTDVTALSLPLTALRESRRLPPGGADRPAARITPPRRRAVATRTIRNGSSVSSEMTDGRLERVSLDPNLEEEYAIDSVVETLPPDWRPPPGTRPI